MYEINCYDSYGNTIDYLTQWDYNRKLIMYIDNYNLLYAPEVHFCNQNSKEALVVQSVVEDNKVVVDIPNILLQEHLPLFMYIYLSDANNVSSQKTIFSLSIPVRYRPKPSEYTYIENITRITAATIEESVFNKLKDNLLMIRSAEQTTKAEENDGINIYTITLTDGTTSSFEVRNGSTGKTAYEYAKDGGYNGTEEEFAEKMVYDYEGEVGQLQKQQNCVTPQMFGAVGDGVADDTTAINNALASGKNVFFPVGTYKVTAPLVVPYGIILSGASGLSTIKTYIPDGYVFKSETSNSLESLNLENLKFENGNTQDATTKLASGNFIYDVTALYIRNCRVYKYYDVFYQVHQNSYISNCRFSGIYHLFCHSITDSVVDGCYINASRYGFPHKSKVFDASLNSTAFINNLVDYFFDVFALTSSASGTITGNVFNRCVNVFHDHIAKMTIIGNVFTGMRSSEVDLSVLTAEQIASLEAEKWCVIKFDNAIYTGTHLMTNVTFANNIGYRCDYYFHVADGTQVVPAFCDFRGNQISTAQGNNRDSIIDVGFRSEDATVNAYNSMHSVYFDFWDMKEYEMLPSANLIGSGAKSVFSFPYMKAVHNGDIYTNIDGEWIKGGGSVEIPDLSEFATDSDLEAYVTEVDFLTEIASVKAQMVQHTPLFANSVEECTDKTKVYVLPDGYIYGYIKTTEETDISGQPKFTDLFSECTFKHGYRYSLSNNGYKAVAGSAIVIPVPSEATNIIIRTKGNITRHSGYSVIYAGTSTESFTEEVGSTTGVNADENGICTYSITKSVGMTYIVFTITEETADAVSGAIVTVNEPIEYKTGTETITKEGFANTGHAFIPTNYESRIIALENEIAELKAKS